MTDRTCPSCNSSDVGEGRFCPDCGQMLSAPNGVRIASFEQRLKGFVVDGTVLFTGAIVGLLFLIDVTGIFNLPNVLVGVLIVLAGGLFGV